MRPGGERKLYPAQQLAEYVFWRLRSDGRAADLLSLPDVFSEGLLAWLARQVRVARNPKTPKSILIILCDPDTRRWLPSLTSSPSSCQQP